MGKVKEAAVLMGQKQQDELEQLVKCPSIWEMSEDLSDLGETPDSIRSQARFKVLNSRYQTLTGKTCLRIGSVMDAVVIVMGQLKGSRR